MFWKTSYPLALHPAAGHRRLPSSFSAVEEAGPSPWPYPRHYWHHLGPPDNWGRLAFREGHIRECHTCWVEDASVPLYIALDQGPPARLTLFNS